MPLKRIYYFLARCQLRQHAYAVRCSAHQEMLSIGLDDRYEPLLPERNGFAQRQPSRRKLNLSSRM
jgi:hypothetical protein